MQRGLLTAAVPEMPTGSANWFTKPETSVFRIWRHLSHWGSWGQRTTSSPPWTTHLLGIVGAGFYRVINSAVSQLLLVFTLYKGKWIQSQPLSTTETTELLLIQPCLHKEHVRKSFSVKLSNSSSFCDMCHWQALLIFFLPYTIFQMPLRFIVY